MNKLIGEREITLGDEKIILKPSFSALCSIEGDLNKSLVDVFEEQRKGSPRFKDVACVIHHCIVDENQKKQFSQEVIGEHMLCNPLHEFASVTFEMIVYVLSGGGGGDDSGKKKAKK